MSQLVEVGFANREENLRLLRKNGGDINKVATVSICCKCSMPQNLEYKRKSTFLLLYIN